MDLKTKLFCFKILPELRTWCETKQLTIHEKYVKWVSDFFYSYIYFIFENTCEPSASCLTFLMKRSTFLHKIIIVTPLVYSSF